LDFNNPLELLVAQSWQRKPGRSRQPGDCRPFQEIPNRGRHAKTSAPKLESEINKINFTA
jgi:hypothetical protein